MDFKCNSEVRGKESLIEGDCPFRNIFRCFEGQDTEPTLADSLVLPFSGFSCVT